MDSDWKRGKLLDYWVQLCTNARITEERMESEHDRISQLSSWEVDQEYNTIIGMEHHVAEFDDDFDDQGW